MCWMCDNPKATTQDYLAHLRSIVREKGWAIQVVEGNRFRSPYAYTVGLAARGRSELVVTGMAAYRAAKLLNEVATHMLHSAVPEPGEQIPLIGGPLLMACEFYGTGIRALQIVHADDRGRWPWQAGYRGARGGQPVLGQRAAMPKAS